MSNVTMLPSRRSFGGDFAISQPRVDPKGYFNIRADVGGVQYGRETERVNFPNTGRVSLDMETDNRIGFGAIAQHKPAQQQVHHSSSGETVREC